MIIHNTKELVARAKGHYRADQIVQGSYGEIHTNAKVEFRGCAIGCLAMPHRQADLRKLVARWEVPPGQWYGTPNFNYEDVEMIETLEGEFGIHPELARMAEFCFEHLPGAEARRFVVRFAEALQEGAAIGPAEIARIHATAGRPDEDDDGLTINTEDVHRYAEVVLDELAAIEPKIAA